MIYQSVLFTADATAHRNPRGFRPQATSRLTALRIFRCNAQLSTLYGNDYTPKILRNRVDFVIFW